VNDFVYKLS